ncbi:MAG: tetratricopeptide repeat protein [Gemmataceae bacterium]|nr:tetratricopeptide repeat protein [Gemmataceae bacterium]MDW8266901.1 tetratricopeptide repeat protein [Gemmataceae bacterium]
MRWSIGAAVFVGLSALVSGDGSVDKLLEEARAALAGGKTDEALKLADRAVAQAPDDARAIFLRGVIRAARREPAEAIRDFDKAIAVDPKLADAYDRRGSEHFKLGHIREALADFDRYLELQPQEKNGHWRRGIALYYAGRFDEGRQQFEAYQKVDTNDVENAVWHFLCVARLHGVERARKELLPIGRDRRVPMMQVYDLFAGKLQPADVLAAVDADQPDAAQRRVRLFYAHQYLGFYFEIMGERTRSLEHMTLAAEKYRIPQYMGDVARVHVELRRRELPKEK